MANSASAMDAAVAPTAAVPETVTHVKVDDPAPFTAFYLRDTLKGKENWALLVPYAQVGKEEPTLPETYRIFVNRHTGFNGQQAKPVICDVSGRTIAEGDWKVHIKSDLPFEGGPNMRRCLQADALEVQRVLNGPRKRTDPESSAPDSQEEPQMPNY
jgi:hypothetical protein